jgi:hypothetical protein
LVLPDPFVFEFRLPFRAAGGLGADREPLALGAVLGAVLGGVSVPVSSTNAGAEAAAPIRRFAPPIVRSPPTGCTIPVRNMISCVPILIRVETII